MITIRFVQALSWRAPPGKGARVCTNRIMLVQKLDIAA